MGTTPRGLRFPEPTDRLNQTAQFIEDLALDVDAQLTPGAGACYLQARRAGGDVQVNGGITYAVQFDAVELEQPECFDSITFTAPAAGLYLAAATLRTRVSNTNGGQYMGGLTARFHVDGVDTDPAAQSDVRGDNGQVSLALSRLVSLAAGGTLKVHVTGSSTWNHLMNGSALTVVRLA